MARAASFRSTPAQQRFIAGRVLLRTVLGELLGAKPEKLRFNCGRHGKPRLAGQPGDEPASFSLAHSGELALVAVSATREVGVDVERIRPIPEAMEIAEMAFDSCVCTTLNETPPEHRDAALLRHWTRLEALAKAAGCGLASLLERVDSLKASDSCGDEYGQLAERFDTIDLPLPLGYVGSLAVEASHGTTAAGRRSSSTRAAFSATAGW